MSRQSGSWETIKYNTLAERAANPNDKPAIDALTACSQIDEANRYAEIQYNSKWGGYRVRDRRHPADDWQKFS
jgi:hypothetical protein